MDYKAVFADFPVLHTPRLVLRKIVENDAEDFFAMRSDPEVMRYIPRPLAVTVDDCLAVIRMVQDGEEAGIRVNWAMELRETQRMIGSIGFVNMKPEHRRAEVGYSLRRSMHRQGFMREALLAVLEYGFNGLQLHTIEAIIDAENVASGSLLKSVGFRQEAYFREDFLHDGVFRNSIHFGMLHHEFSEQVRSAQNSRVTAPPVG